MMEFRDLTLARLQKFVGQKFFSVRDYIRGEWKLLPLQYSRLRASQQPSPEYVHLHATLA
jgi:hypothetical protein